ncbi:MAG: AAA family ATPase [candidate division Zixibacteria bacterium]|nr:AAA family ATPase [candidate division Zixibacteria bacterium]
MLTPQEEIISRRMKDDTPKVSAQTLAISSGKGGVGKSFITLNLGLKLTQLNQKVLVLDADLGLANISLMANLNPTHTLEDVLNEKCSLDEAITTYSNLHILPALSDLSGFDILSNEKIDRLQRSLPEIEKIYDFVLIDTSAGVSPFTFSFLLGSDKTLLVLTPQPTSIANGYALLKFILSKDSEKDVALLWNMVNSENEAYQLEEKFNLLCDNFLGVKVKEAGFVLNDERVESSITKQMPLIIRYTFSQAATCLEKIALRMINDKRNTEKVELGMLNRG